MPIATQLFTGPRSKLNMFADMLSEAQKSAIADVAIAHAELEAELDHCVIQLCNLHWPHGAILLDGVGVERKIGMFARLLEIEFNGRDVPTMFKATCADLKALNTQRNTIIHGQWTLRSLANYDGRKPSLAGSARVDIENRDIVVHARRRGKEPALIGARSIKKAADLIVLNRRLLHQLFWDHFAKRVQGLSGLPEKPDTTADKLSNLVGERSARKQ